MRPAIDEEVSTTEAILIIFTISLFQDKHLVRQGCLEKLKSKSEKSMQRILVVVNTSSQSSAGSNRYAWCLIGL